MCIFCECDNNYSLVQTWYMHVRLYMHIHYIYTQCTYTHCTFGTDHVCDGALVQWRSQEIPHKFENVSKCLIQDFAVCGCH